MEEISPNVYLGSGVLQSDSLISSLLQRQRKIALITDETVAQLYGYDLQKRLLGSELLTIPPGESSKSREMKAQLENELYSLGFARDSLIIALGGGVVTDLAGFVAATYCRGVPLYSIPTTLLGMVDAALGGKTGINLPMAKNFVGAFYPAEELYLDPSLLQSLSVQDFRDGMAEVIKHALIADPEGFEWLKEQKESILERHPETLQKLVSDSARIKLDVVRQDQKEGGLRRILNFGHTVGHAIESLHCYELSHGQAVAMGCVIEAYLSLGLGSMDLASVGDIASIFRAYGFTLATPKLLTAEAIYDAMIQDKKSFHGYPRSVFLEKIGNPCSFSGAYCAPLEKQAFIQQLKEMPHDLCQCLRT